MGTGDRLFTDSSCWCGYVQDRRRRSRKQMKPVRSEAHLRWIRTLPCVISELSVIPLNRSCRFIEAAHIGPHGMAQKASDLDTVPLCRHHHEELHQLGRRVFEAKYGINFNEILERLRKKPRIVIAERPMHAPIRWFMAEFEGETFWLCPVSTQPFPNIPEFARRAAFGPRIQGIWDAWRICKDLCCKDRLRIAS